MGKYTPAVYGVHREKLPDEPVFPNIMKKAELVSALLSQLMEYKPAKSQGILDELGIKVELGEDLFENLRQITLVCMQQESYKMAQILDKFKKTYTLVDGNTVRVLPGKGHKGIGFYPITTGDLLEYKDEEGNWIEAVLSMAVYEDDGTIEVTREDNGEEVKVNPLFIKRK